MTTDITTGFAGQIAGLDIPDEGTAPVSLGRLNWFHGNKAGKTPGAFFAKATEFNGEPSAPWKSDDRFENDAGYSASRLRLAFIAIRSQWFIPQENAAPIWITGYEAGARKAVECLCLVEGVAEPMVLSLSKVTKAKPIEQIVKTYREGLLRQASRIAGRNLPLWSFWLPIGNPERDGKTQYEEVMKDGKSTGAVVTSPVLYLPENPMDTLFVGADLLQYGAEIFREHAAWTTERRLPPNTVEGEVISYPALPAPKNPVVALDDAELF